jgi:hypothetical protein
MANTNDVEQQTMNDTSIHIDNPDVINNTQQQKHTYYLVTDDWPENTICGRCVHALTLGVFTIGYTIFWICTFLALNIALFIMAPICFIRYILTGETNFDYVLWNNIRLRIESD